MPEMKNALAVSVKALTSRKKYFVILSPLALAKRTQNYLPVTDTLT
jgi:hypothetical protein